MPLPPASVVAPFTGFNIIVNSLPLVRFVRISTCCISTFSSGAAELSSPKRLVRIAPCTLGEQLTRCRCIGILIVFVTATLSVFFKEAHSEHWTLDVLRRSCFSGAFWPTRSFSFHG